MDQSFHNVATGRKQSAIDYKRGFEKTTCWGNSHLELLVLLRTTVVLSLLLDFLEYFIVLYQLYLCMTIKVHAVNYPPEVRSMKYCCLGVFRKEYFRLLTKWCK